LLPIHNNLDSCFYDTATITLAARVFTTFIHFHINLIYSGKAGAYQAGAYQAGAYQAGAHQAGAYQSGAYQSGAYQSGAYQSGAT
jgi:hypothetical protein